MEANLRDIDLIQRYIEQNLTDSEKHELEYRLVEEPKLHSLYQEHKQLIQGIRYSNLQGKLTQLRAFEAALPAADVAEQRTWWVPLSMAASVLLLIGVWFFAFRDARPLHEQLYAANFEAFDSPGSGLTRSNENAVTLKAKAYDAYDAGRYEEAAKLFERALKEKDDAIMHLCLGNSYLVINQTEKAERIFQHILDDHGDLVTPATWYLALSYLKQNKMEKTKATLWGISKSSTYGEKARKLLRELE